MFGLLPSVPLWAFVTSAGFSALIGAATCVHFYGLKLSRAELVLAISVPVLLCLSLATSAIPSTTVLWSFILILCIIILSIGDAMDRAPRTWGAVMLAFGLLWSANLWLAALVSLIWLIGALMHQRRPIFGANIEFIAATLAWHGVLLIPDLCLITGGVLLLTRLADGLINPTPPTCLPIPKTSPKLHLVPALSFANLTIWLGGPIL